MADGIVQVPCKHCKKSFLSKRSAKHVYCSVACYRATNRGPNHNNWCGGRWVCKEKGYIRVSNQKGGHEAEHILIAEKALGKPLPKGFVVHHINGNKTDNRSDNLLICSSKYHTELHHRMSLLYAQEHFGVKNG